MNVLFVCSGNKGKINPFIAEQVDSLKNLGVTGNYFLIQGKGVFGYLSNLQRLRRFIRKGNYQLIHAHYGLSGLLSVLQRKVPVVVTFHGSDIRKPRVLRYSRLAARLSAYNIVVERSFTGLLGAERKTAVIPCGVDFNIFFETDRNAARRVLGLPEDSLLVLFTSSFGNPVKNYPLARKAIEMSASKPLLIELKNYSRHEVNLLMNAADILLMTSFSEGSPQVVKEALACRLPVISTPVGDVAELAQSFDGISIVPFDAKKIAEVLDNRLMQRKRNRDNQLIRAYDNVKIAREVQHIYSTILNKAD